ncbi:DMT family transporter [Ramlibacter sp. AW1]|uniref:DMT family transporter n=1 Tax=Ramlibacter aurantiacus TaxID=2801330 RepID=A0A936ZMD0_9BURK|nr:DMT family transporter [Ramlibacter aurantiacus]MBL0422432.1 DMT family transporter [Ramlibacter aurantiacus]
MGVTLALLAMAAHGTSMVVASFAMRHLSSAPGSMLAAAAGLPAGLLAGAGQLAFGSGVELPSLRAVLGFILAGVFSTYLGRWLIFRSIELMGPSRAAGLQSTSPLITAFFGWLLLGEVLGPLGFAGIGLGIAGLFAMSMGGHGLQQGRTKSVAARHRGFLLGSLLVGLGSAAAYSASHVFRAAGVREWNEPLLGAAIGTFAGLAALLLASHKQMTGYLREIAAQPVWARVYVAVGFMQFVGQSLVTASMNYIPVSLVALISMCTPLLVMPLSYFAMGKQENLSLAAVLGICLTLSGIVLVVLHGRPQP